VKAGSRALAVADSYPAGGTTATVAGAVVRADRVVDDLVFSEWTVGGLDSTDTVIDCWERLDRPDVGYVLCSGVAPAWFNLLDLHAIHTATDRPVLSVSFEASDGLAGPIREQFEGDDLDTRLALYERLPPREALTVNGETLYVRSVGCPDPKTVVRAFTPEGGRPEPLRVARLAARAGRAFRADS
jgi:endonuclease V-like protein UPF0215 family